MSTITTGSIFCNVIVDGGVGGMRMHVVAFRIAHMDADIQRGYWFVLVSVRGVVLTGKVRIFVLLVARMVISVHYISPLSERAIMLPVYSSESKVRSGLVYLGN